MSYILERKWSPFDFSLHPEREESYKKLLSWAESFDILGSDDPDRVINKYAEHLLQYTEDMWEIPGMGIQVAYKRAADDFREFWGNSGFMQPDIRECVLHMMQETFHTSNDELKFFISAVFARADINLAEYEELRFYFADKVKPGIFKEKDEALRFLAYVADSSSELFGKRILDYFCFRMHWLKGEPELAEAFFNSEEGFEMRTCGVIDWYCGDVDREGKSFPYADIMRKIFCECREGEAYQRYIENPWEAVEAGFNKFQEELG